MDYPNLKNRILLEANFWKFDHRLAFLGVTRGPTQNQGPIGLAVLMFFRQKQIDNQSIYIILLYIDNPSLGKHIFTLFLAWSSSLGAQYVLYGLSSLNWATNLSCLEYHFWVLLKFRGFWPLLKIKYLRYFNVQPVQLLEIRFF